MRMANIYWSDGSKTQESFNNEEEFKSWHREYYPEINLIDWTN